MRGLSKLVLGLLQFEGLLLREAQLLVSGSTVSLPTG